MEISDKKKLEMESGSFGAEVHDGKLLVPASLRKMLRKRNLHTAEEFVAALHGFPTGFADELGWTLRELKVARQLLLNLLAGHVNELLLDPPIEDTPPYGALRPGIRKQV